MIKKPEQNETVHIVSSGDMTGFEPAPPLTNDEEDAYASLGGVPAPHCSDKPRRIPRDPCGGGR